jgi:hypothetical protein
MASVITAERTEGLIEEAPGWALVELTVPKERLRADARREVTRHAYSALYQPKNVEAGQLRCHFKVVDRRSRARGLCVRWPTHSREVADFLYHGRSLKR